MSVRKFTDEQEQEIRRRYEAGETTSEIARSIPNCKRNATIAAAIRRQGGTLRTQPESIKGKPNLAARKFTDTQEQEICRRYVAGESTTAIGADLESSTQTIINVLGRHGVSIRDMKAAKGGLSLGAESEVCKRYLAGESALQLGDFFNVSHPTICKILEENGISRRGAQPSFSDEIASEVCRRYVAGESTVRLGLFYGVHATTVQKTLKRHGIQIRDNREAQGGLPADVEPEVCRRYINGESTVALADAYDVSNPSIGNILKRNGIEVRKTGGLGDSVQDVIDGTGHYTHARECELYLFSLARYADMHCKVGIAFDTDVRASVSDGEYGEEHLRLMFSTRTEAYFLEQAVHDATRGNADCPDDLIGWTGHTEVRAMPADDMVPIILNLQQEMEDLGVWEFAARYVPMTAAQRATCQQRAIQEVAA